MSWDSFRVVAALLFLLFALLLIGLPLHRILTGRLRFEQTWGFLVAGVGFGALAAGLRLLPDPRAQTIIVAGVIATIIGNIAQQRIARNMTAGGRR
jgi:hypothetical protein